MEKSLKDSIIEFADIAKACPPNLQEKCFTLLLEDFLSSKTKSKSTNNCTDQKTHESPKEESEGTENGEGENGSEQEDFADKDLHVKARKFLKDSGLTIDHINEIFYKDGNSIEALYEDLKTTKMAESQIRVGLLQALKSGISTGEFAFNGEDVRSEVQLRKCYDPANFTAHFKNNKSLFDGFEKYDKKNPVIKLSKDGRDSLASLIKELK